jgi:hypothetical protein
MTKTVVKDQKKTGMEEFFPEAEKARFDKIKERARELGVLGISFTRGSASDIECYESVLDIIARDKEILDKNAKKSDEA